MQKLEVSDVIIDYDINTLQRKPVAKNQAIAKLEHTGKWAQKIVQNIPDTNGILQQDVVDDLLLRSHYEMQRLWEEFLSCTRIAHILQIFISSLRKQNVKPPYRIVDVGCGIGYNLRWLAAHKIFGDDIELVGVDYNAVLIENAQKFAEMENLNCKFLVGNAFTVSQENSIFMSTGVLHHFSPEHLTTFFAEQNSCHPWGFFHFDIQPHLFAPIGSWFFHMARMRVPLAKHDGYMSACRAHSIEVLKNCAGEEYQLVHHGRRIPLFPFIRNMHALIGLHPSIADDFLHQLPNLRNLWRKLQ